MSRWLLGLALLAACARPAPPAPLPGPAAALDGMVRWRERAVRDYTVSLTVSCMCIHRGDYRLTVRDGRTASALDGSSAAVSAERLALLPSVDALYQQIADALLSGTPVRVELDPALSFPTQAVIGTPENDAGVVYQMRDLVPTSR
jgi:hypothetical protein